VTLALSHGCAQSGGRLWLSTTVARRTERDFGPEPSLRAERSVTLALNHGCAQSATLDLNHGCAQSATLALSHDCAQSATLAPNHDCAQSATLALNHGCAQSATLDLPRFYRAQRGLGSGFVLYCAGRRLVQVIASIGISTRVGAAVSRAGRSGVEWSGEDGCCRCV
jgi:hypothetical protein